MRRVEIEFSMCFGIRRLEFCMDARIMFIGGVDYVVWGALAEYLVF